MAVIIREKNINLCPICKSKGNIKYQGLTDRLFHTPGVWKFNECLNNKCGVLWLDSVPSAADFKKAYEQYYTHVSNVVAENSNPLKKVLDKINREYISYKFGKEKQKYRILYLFLNFIYAIHPIIKIVIEVNNLFLGQTKHGKLLDIGCGQGDFLLSMQDLGWGVCGVEIDKVALNIAKEKKLNVYHYNSRSFEFPSDSFDLITLNNVFEHMNNLEEVFTEIYRILKKGGRLFIITPNKNSMSHRIFKEHWRGLEPPRHLQIMTSESLSKFLFERGFIEIVTFSRVVSYYIVECSYLLMKGKETLNLTEKLLLRVFINIYAVISRLRPDMGDLIFSVMSK